MKKLRYAIIGTGNISGKHLNGYSRQKDRVEIVAACDLIEERVSAKAKEFNIPDTYLDYKEIIKREDIDIVSVCLPNHLHHPVTIEALKSGKHVHVEKPMAINGKQAHEMYEESKKNNRKLMVGVNNRFTTQSQFVKRYIDSGAIGKIYYTRCGWVRRDGLSYAGWFCNKELAGGGPLIDLGVHYIDLCMYFLGFPQIDSVTARTYSKFGVNDELRQLYTFEGAVADFNTKYTVEDFVTGFVNLKDDSCLNFEISWASNIEYEKMFFELLGDKGGIKYETGPAGIGGVASSNKLRIVKREGGQFVNIEPSLKSDVYKTTEFGHFVDSILNNTEPTVAPPLQTAMTMDIIDAAYQSAEKGGRQVIL